MLIYKITKSDGYRLCQSAGHEAISHFNVGFKIIWVQVTSTLVLLNGRLLLFPFSSLPFNVNMWYHWDLCAVVRQIYRRDQQCQMEYVTCFIILKIGLCCSFTCIVHKRLQI